MKPLLVKFGLSVSIALFFGSLAITAQTSSPLPAQSNLVRPSPAADCPVSLHAEHQFDGSLINTAGGHPTGLGQRLHVAISPDSRTAVTATFAVRGTTPKGRLKQTAADEEQSLDAVQTLTVHFTAARDGSSSAALWVPGFTSVTEIDVKAMTFSDGSTWKASNHRACRVISDLMLIAQQR